MVSSTSATNLRQCVFRVCFANRRSSIRPWAVNRAEATKPAPFGTGVGWITRDKSSLRFDRAWSVQIRSAVSWIQFIKPGFSLQSLCSLWMVEILQNDRFFCMGGLSQCQSLEQYLTQLCITASWFLNRKTQICRGTKARVHASSLPFLWHID